METNFDNKCAILSELWIKFRDDVELSDFIEYNDIGLPLAYFVHAGIVKPELQATDFINETWDLFIAALEIEDVGFESLNQILSIAEEE